VLDAPSPKYGLPVLLLAGVATFPLVAFLAVRLAFHRPTLDIQANARPAPVAANVQPRPQPPQPPAPEPQSAPTAAVELPAPTVATSPAVGPIVTALPQEKVKPPPPKVQSIIFHPTRPSALINGRVAFLGDRIPEGEVVAISQNSVTVIAANETNVLTLAQ
jgi:hypothetical protein